MAKVVPDEEVEPEKPIEKIKKISLIPITNGVVKGNTITAETLWTEGPIAIFVARRAACRVCRLDAMEISELFQKQFSHIKLVCIIKEIASEGSKFTDKELGVEEFQRKFFNNKNIYWDTDLKFYEFFGNKSAIWQPYSKTPCALYSDYRRLQCRISNAGIDKCNYLAGETFLKGGFLLVAPNEGVVYQHAEMTGSEMPLEDIEQAVWNLIVKYPVKEHFKSVETFVEQFSPRNEKYIQLGSLQPLTNNINNSKKSAYVSTLYNPPYLN